MKIGLLGGSFNPPHQGHLYISREIRKRLKLHQIWWLPNKQNPLKSSSNSSFNPRLHDCRQLVQNSPKILVKDWEIKLRSAYSIDLIRHIIRRYPQHQFFWIIGADNLVNFHLWHDWKQIIALTPLIVADRGNFANAAVNSKAFLYCQKLANFNGYHNRCSFLRIRKLNISSTLLRNSLISAKNGSLQKS